MIAGVLLVSARRPHPRPLPRVFDGVMALAAVALPLGAASVPELGGALQRCLFALAYAWFGLEALRAMRRHGGPFRAATESGVD